MNWSGSGSWSRLEVGLEVGHRRRVSLSQVMVVVMVLVVMVILMVEIVMVVTVIV